ncbi:MAG: hypothetical protein GXP56_19485 [Deltaproteobacteria bacterium]|nr:hypothetical protein [Deltaproteobacteria bacterium]
MVKLIKIILIFTGISCFYFFSRPVFAAGRVLTDVKVIHASMGPGHIDPGLKKIISELESVFKYTSYRLLKDRRLNLGFNQEGRVDLPGKRTLIVMPTDMDGKRIRYQINIKKNNHLIFKTRVLLRNDSSITIGGPKFNNGFLLFNISGSMR